MKELAERCGFTNPTRCTGQGKRSEGVSRMVNSKEGIPLVESMRASRHDDVSAHLGYVEPDEEAHSKRYRALASKTVLHGAKVEEEVVDTKMEAKLDERKFSAEEWMSRSGGGMQTNMTPLNMAPSNMAPCGMMMQPHQMCNPFMMGMQNGIMGMQNGALGMQNGALGMQNGAMAMGMMGMQNGMMGWNNGMMGMQGGEQMMGMVRNLMGGIKTLKDQLEGTKKESTE